MTQILLDLANTPSFAVSDYVVTDVNHALFDALLKPQQWNSYGCLLQGDASSGKTHLAQIWAQHMGAYYINAAEKPSLILPDAGHIVVDNIDAQTVDMTALFHLLNRMKESQSTILLTTRRLPKAFVSLLDVLSRLNALYVLHTPAFDEALAAAIAQKLFSDRQLRVGDEVVRYILSHAERSYQAIHTLINALDLSAMRKGQGVTVPLVRNALEGAN